MEQVPCSPKRSLWGLDDTNRKILFQLDVDAGISRQQFAKELGITRQSLEYRIRKLVEKGVVKRFYALTDFHALGLWQYNVFTKLQDLNKINEMLEYLVKNERTHWVTRCHGMFDLAYYLHVRDPAEFASIQNEINEKFGTSIQSRNILIIERILFFTKPFSEQSFAVEEFFYGKVKPKKKLGEKDRKILSFLSLDGLANSNEIAKGTGLTPDIVKYRIKKMKKNGLISTIRADIDFEKIGFNLFKVFIRLNSHSPDLFKRMEEYCKTRKHMIQYVRVVGPWDIMLECATENRAQLEHELANLRKEFAASIRDYEVLETYDEQKHSYFTF